VVIQRMRFERLSGVLRQHGQHLNKHGHLHSFPSERNANESAQPLFRSSQVVDRNAGGRVVEKG
jgi:hypothetical protein